MDISSVGSTLAATGSGQGTSSFASSVAGFSLPNDTSASNTAASTQAPSLAQVTQAVKQVNDAFAQKNQNMYATLEKDSATGIDVVKFVDQETKQTISQFPSKAILAIAQSLQNSSGAGGQLVNATA